MEEEVEEENNNNNMWDSPERVAGLRAISMRASGPNLHLALGNSAHVVAVNGSDVVISNSSSALIPTLYIGENVQWEEARLTFGLGMGADAVLADDVVAAVDSSATSRNAIGAASVEEMVDSNSSVLMMGDGYVADSDYSGSMGNDEADRMHVHTPLIVLE